MATYVPNANELTQPTEDKELVTSAAEFRTLKAKVESNQTRIDTLEGSALQISGTDYTADADIDLAGNQIKGASSITTQQLVLGGVIIDPSDFDPDSDAQLRADLATTGAGKGAEMVAFKQSGTGAVDRTASDKLREFVSVKDFGAVGDGATDDYAAFMAAAATGKRVYVPKGTYRVNTPPDFANVVVFGDGVEHSRIECNSATTTDPVLYLGGNSCLQNIEIGWASARLTGSEAAGQRAGIRPYSPASGLPLQRGALISNVRIRLCGTGVYDPPGTGPATYFSVTFDGVEVRDFTYRGWDAQSSIRTGNRYDNIYINQAGGPYATSSNVDCGFLLAGEESEASFGLINVEWLKAGRAISLTGVRGIAGGAFHIEQFTQRNTYAAAVEFDKTAGHIDALTVYYCPITTAGWWLMRLKDSTYDGATYNPTTCASLRIGTLHVKGLNDGAQVVGGTGLTGLTNFAFTDREVGAVGPYALQIDRYVWNTFKTDHAVYLAYPNDPHALIQSVATAGGPPVGKSTLTTGYVRRPDGLIEMWGTCSAGANSTVTITFPTINGTSTAGFPNACLHVQAEPDDIGTTEDYRYNASQKTATNFKLTNTSPSTVTGFWRAIGY